MSRPPTPFEEAVYRVVRRIPKGQTRSYRWVAERLGDPKLARAVGNALNRNPYAPHVPCHRVIKSDGSLGGFARGARQKLALLREEGWSAGPGCAGTPRHRSGPPSVRAVRSSARLRSR